MQKKSLLHKTCSFFGSEVFTNLFEHKNKVVCGLLTIAALYIAMLGLCAASMALAEINNAGSWLTFIDHADVVKEELQKIDTQKDMVAFIIAGIVAVFFSLLVMFATGPVFINYKKFDGGFLFCVIKYVTGVVSAIFGIYLVLLLTIFPLPEFTKLLRTGLIAIYIGFWCYHTPSD